MFKRLTNKLLELVDYAIYVAEDRSNMGHYIPEWDPHCDVEKSIEFVDLVELYLEEHGYKTMRMDLTPRPAVLTVFNSKIKHWLRHRNNTISFRIGQRVESPYPFGSREEADGVFNIVYMFKHELVLTEEQSYTTIRHHYYKICDQRVLCEITNPKCLEIILEEVKKHYGR